ncbi:MAG: hypothetical protein ABW171_04930, partial [Steroidobacter sp.]
IQTLRTAEISSASVGEFKLAPTAKPTIDRSISVRGSQLSSPNDESFALYLKYSLLTELQAAGKYDASAPTVITGQLTENELNAAGFSTATAKLGAKFAVARAGRTLFEKTLLQESSWESSFVGAVAIPEAINQYTEMYTKLLAKLFADDEFKQALKP